MAAESLRIAAGSKGSQVFQCADNPKLVAAITEWDSLGKAKSYSQSPALREAQQKSGVYSQPEIFVLEPCQTIP
ncbi:MAG: hypothetical protein Q8N39_06115 [Pelolinea sp.]|nr:hypothetical protein [Pelolinea sp.]